MHIADYIVLGGLIACMLGGRGDGFVQSYIALSAPLSLMSRAAGSGAVVMACFYCAAGHIAQPSNRNI
jgi:hypothetical protein